MLAPGEVIPSQTGRAGRTHRWPTDEFRREARSKPSRPRERNADDHGQPQPLDRALRPLPGRHHDRPRRHDRERRAAVDPRRSRLLADVARVDRQRVPADVRRLPAPRRAARRPLRPPAAVPHRHRALHRCVARLRARELAGDPDRRTSHSGRRRGDRLRRCAVSAHAPLHRHGRPREGDGRLRLRPLGRRGDRCARRGHPHRPAQLALDLLHQPAGRHHRLRPLAALAAGRARAGRNRQGRLRRRDHGDQLR